MRFLTALLPLALCALSIPVCHAGSFSVTYSGGTYTGYGSSGQTAVLGTWPDALGNYTVGGVSYYGWGGTAVGITSSGGTSGTAACSGAITATLAWNPASGQTAQADPPPQTVILAQTAAASVSGSSYGPGATVSASCGDGLGDSLSPAATPMYNTVNGQTTQIGVQASARCARTKYSALSGTLTVPACTPSVSGTDSNGPPAQGTVVYSVSASPVTISVGGATANPADGSLNILIGQRCAPTLAGVPAGLTVSNYTWTVDGTTFQTWSPTTPAVGTKPADPNASYSVDGSGPLNVAAPSWYWNVSGSSGSKQSETITCTATVTPPTGQGSAFTVTASQKVNVYIPNWTASATLGTMRVDAELLGNGHYCLYAGNTPGDTVNDNGIEIAATLASPLPGVLQIGNIDLAQVITQNNYSYIKTNAQNKQETHNDPNNGSSGLDAVFPYGWKPGLPGKAADSPFIDLTQYNAISASLVIKSTDYLMYKAPGSSQYVPLSNFSWTASGSAALSLGQTWQTFSSTSIGSVTPSGRNDFTASTAFPNWTKIIKTVPF